MMNAARGFRVVLFAALVGSALLLAGCGSSGARGSTSLDAGSDAGQTGCIADDAGCGGPGSKCCSGFCPAQTCAPANVNIAASCPAPCGGDPVGKWHAVGGCVAGNTPKTGVGAVVGTLDVSAGASAGSYTFGGHFDYLYSDGNGNNPSGGGDFSQEVGPDAGPNAPQYCVDGANLWVFIPTAPLPIEYAQ